MRTPILKLSTYLLFTGLAASSLASASTYTFRVSSTGVRTAAVAPSSGPSVSFNFSACGATGPYGPTLAQCTAAYSSTSLAGAVTIAPVQGVQSWTVPATGSYTLVLAGASGGLVQNKPLLLRGLGAVLTTRLALTQGAVLKIMVGQAGPAGANDAGGGGGTFVVSGTTALAVAGGGGGAGSDSGNAHDASTSISPSLGYSSSTNDAWGGGGSGFGVNSTIAGPYAGQSYSFLSGGVGGGVAANTCGGNYQSAGGFGGGGGGGCAGGGAGGGYTASVASSGAGGTTYTSGTMLSVAATNPGAGYVTIQRD